MSELRHITGLHNQRCKPGSLAIEFALGETTLPLLWREHGDRVATPAAINLEICRINGHDCRIPPLLAHGHEASIGQVHGLVRIFPDQFQDPGVVVGHIPGANQKAVCEGFQDLFSRAEEMSRFREDRLAGIKR